MKRLPVAILFITCCPWIAMAQADSPPSAATLPVESGDALGPLRARIGQAWDQWQSVKNDVNATLARIGDPCHPRVDSEMTRLAESMNQYFAARLLYTQTWSKMALANLEKTKNIATTQASRVKDLHDMKDQEQKDFDALQERLNKLPKDGSGVTDDVRKEGEELKKQIESIKGDLDDTIKLEDAATSEAATMEQLFATRAESIRKQEKALIVARALWSATYNYSKQTYAGKCRLTPDFGTIPRPPKQ